MNYHPYADEDLPVSSDEESIGHWNRQAPKITCIPLTHIKIHYSQTKIYRMVSNSCLATNIIIFTKKHNRSFYELTSGFIFLKHKKLRLHANPVIFASRATNLTTFTSSKILKLNKLNKFLSAGASTTGKIGMAIGANEDIMVFAS